VTENKDTRSVPVGQLNEVEIFRKGRKQNTGQQLIEIKYSVTIRSIPPWNKY
jgi:hypothetical protein